MYESSDWARLAAVARISRECNRPGARRRSSSSPDACVRLLRARCTMEKPWRIRRIKPTAPAWRTATRISSHWWVIVIVCSFERAVIVTPRARSCASSAGELWLRHQRRHWFRAVNERRTIAQETERLLRSRWAAGIVPWDTSRRGMTTRELRRERDHPLNIAPNVNLYSRLVFAIVDVDVDVVVFVVVVVVVGRALRCVLPDYLVPPTLSLSLLFALFLSRTCIACVYVAQWDLKFVVSQPMSCLIHVRPPKSYGMPYRAR